MLNVRQITFDIVHRLKEAQTHIDLYTELRRCGGVFGYEAFLVAGLPQSPRENLFDCRIISGWPPEWERRYQDRRYMHVDPVIRHIRGTADPFLWQEAAEAVGTPQGTVVFDEARAYGLHAGLCVPFHQIDGGEAGVSFGGDRYAPTPDERAGLHLVAIYAMSCAKAILRREGEADGKDEAPPPLTGREMECLKWAADGKSAWDIGVILSISSRTVEQHLASAARKLDAVSRAQCVAEAIRRGLIG
ncbi:LuxR family transcriptional regulator [uncultured Methylobacterium sp.]|uniref:LuxR family transcriptional regulator n=1 Tax=uncultured Methylobacterium sp. TaxID=157278 RepID=UPI0035CB6564